MCLGEKQRNEGGGASGAWITRDVSCQAPGCYVEVKGARNGRTTHICISQSSLRCAEPWRKGRTRQGWEG